MDIFFDSKNAGTVPPQKIFPFQKGLGTHRTVTPRPGDVLVMCLLRSVGWRKLLHT
jgi:hypothetical protein